jgi:parallel beta-helix repeat protein
VVGAIAFSGCAVGSTGAPTEVSVDRATIAGKIASTIGGQTAYWVEYGTTSALGSATPHQTVTVSKGTTEPVTVAVTGLARDTAYHYRLCARDSEAGICGANLTFRTQDVVCGETVTRDVTLTGSLDCSFDSPGPFVGDNGLVIGADGLDIDLAGHSIQGPIFQGSGGVRGIDNSGGYDDVTVRDGGLGNWGDGVHLDGASRNVMTHLGVQGSPSGVSITGGSDNEIRSSDVTGRLNAIKADGQTGLVITNVTVAFGVAGGPALSIGGNNGLIDHNVIKGFGFGSGMEVRGSENLIVGNTVTGQGGAPATEPGGIWLLSGSDNVVAENETSGSHLVTPGSTAGSVGDGIFVGPQVTGTLVRDNYSHDNEGDGIEVQNSATRLRGNRANHNGDLGIQAVAGVTDLGGNTASGNGNPLQCTNVFCQ